MKYIYIFFTSALFIYLILLTLIYFNQRKLLYLPSENNYLDDPIKFDYTEYFIEVDKNIKIRSWLIKKDLKNYKTLLFFHGNAGNLFNESYKLNKLSELNLNILLSHGEVLVAILVNQLKAIYIKMQKKLFNG